MPGSKCAYLQAKNLDRNLGVASFTPAANLWVCLSTSAFDPTATSVPDEVAAADYLRIEVANNATTFPNATGSGPATKSNGIDFLFATATNDWGTILSAYLFDASTAGNGYYGGDLAAPTPNGSGSTFKIPATQWIYTEL